MTLRQTLRGALPTFTRFEAMKKEVAPAGAFFLTIAGDTQKLDRVALAMSAEEICEKGFEIYAHLEYDRCHYRTGVSLEGLSFAFKTESDEVFFALMVL